MIYVLLVALAVAVAAAVVYEVRLRRREEAPQELEGDWWRRFEAEFREYARRWEAAGGARQRRGPRPPRSTRRRDVAEGSF